MGKMMQQLSSMKKQMGEVQSELKKVVVTVTEGNITLTMNGEMDLLDVVVKEANDPIRLAKDIKKAFSKAMGDIKKQSAGKLSGITKGLGLNLPGM